MKRKKQGNGGIKNEVGKKKVQQQLKMRTILAECELCVLVPYVGTE